MSRGINTLSDTVFYLKLPCTFYFAYYHKGFEIAYNNSIKQVNKKCAGIFYVPGPVCVVCCIVRIQEAHGLGEASNEIQHMQSILQW